MGDVDLEALAATARAHVLRVKGDTAHQVTERIVENILGKWVDWDHVSEAGLIACLVVSLEESARRSADLERERDEARAQLEALNAGDMAKAYLLSAGPDYAKSGFQFLLKTPMGAAMAEFCCEALKGENAPNYVSFSADHDELGPLEFIVQRVNGETAAQQLTAARARIAELVRALKPFAEEAAKWSNYVDDTDYVLIAHFDDVEFLLEEVVGEGWGCITYSKDIVTVGDIRRARTLLKQEEDGNG